MIDRKPIVGVMGSHDEPWEEYARPLGELIARRGYHLMTGAGGGIMIEVCRAFQSVPMRTGVALGIRPAVDYKGEELSKDEFPNSYIDIPIITPLSAKAQSDAMPYSRNLVNVMSSKALVILPGSHGTRNEVSLGLLYEKPLMLFGPDEAFDQFPEDPLRSDNIAHVEQFLNDVFGEEG
ncbi:MAG: DNA-binding protein [Rhodospirillales bacterium]|nr:DNA-binding protein [Alphaproteobacteria bacterium]MCB9980901.1 DNA-binding protein [Rhodospirillales bacterium]